MLYWPGAHELGSGHCKYPETENSVQYLYTEYGSCAHKVQERNKLGRNAEICSLSAMHVEKKCGRETHFLFVESKKEVNQAINSHVSALKILNQGEKEQVWAISLHPKVVKTCVVSVSAGLRYAPYLICTRTEASKIIIQAHELIGSLTSCEDAQNEGRKQGVIQVFHPIQSVKSTNTMITCYTCAKSSQVR